MYHASSGVKGNRCPRCRSLLVERFGYDELFCWDHCGYSRPVSDRERIERLEQLVDRLTDHIRRGRR